MINYAPNNHYWVVAGSATEVYSSAVNDYVPVADAGYVAWLAKDNVATRIASEAELGEVLAQYDLEPVPAAMKEAFRDNLADKVPIRLLLQVLFIHENRIRALEGNPAIDKAQFKNALKNML